MSGRWHAGWHRRAARARHRRWACGLGVLLANGLCTQPVLTRFDSVLFLSQFLDIVREPGSWTLFITNFFFEIFKN